MNGTDRIPVVETNPANQADLAAVFATESPVRACMAEGNVQGACTLCRELYGEIVGRYCLAVVGDPRSAREVETQFWESFEQELAKADMTRTVRSVVLGLARRRCAYLLETTAHRLPAAVLGQDAATAERRDSQKPTAPELARRLLMRLRPTERELLILRYVSNLTYTEIGSLWEIGEREARVRLSQAIVRATVVASGEEQIHG